MSICDTPLRRAILQGVIPFCVLPRGLAVASSAPVAISGPHRGPGNVLPPVPIPDMPVVMADGRTTDLVTLTRGRVTAVNFVLTGCGSICPVLGTIFARVQDEFGKSINDTYQLLSLSLDPLGDTPHAFAAWLARFNAGPQWRGAIPQVDAKGIATLLRAWGLSSGTSSIFHTETVLLVDRAARLVFRFPDLPDPVSVAAMMRQLARVV
jgi:protein SCO1/2